MTTDLESIYDELNSSLESMDSLMRTSYVLESLIDLYEIHSTNTNVSQEHVRTAKLALEMAVAGSSYESRHLVPGSENWIDSVSLEDLENSIKNNISKIGAQFNQSIQGYFSNFTFLLTFFDTHESKLRKLSESLRSSGVRRKSFSMKGERYLLHNEEPVKSIDDYVKVFKSDMDILTNVLVRCLEYQDKNTLQATKTLFKAFSSKKYKELFEDRVSFIDDIIRLAKMKKPQRRIMYNTLGDEYASDFLLGMWYIYARKHDVYKEDDVAEYKEKEGYFSLIISKATNIDKNVLDKSVDFDNITERQLLNLIDASLTAVQEYKQAFKFVSKLSHLGKINFVNDFIAGGALSLPIYRIFISNYRMVLYMSLMVMTTTTSAFYAAKGNVKFVEKLVNKAL